MRMSLTRCPPQVKGERRDRPLGEMLEDLLESSDLPPKLLLSFLPLAIGKRRQAQEIPNLRARLLDLTLQWHLLSLRHLSELETC